ncbi:MAG: nucleotidyltransferase domain-containing protein [Bacteroidota bacterium]
MDQTTVNLVIKEFRNALISSGILVDNIVLFGSQVTGQTHEGSDIDLIIISSDFIGKDIFDRCNMTLSAEMQTRKKFMVPMDILTMTPEEYLESLAGKFYNTRIVA